MTLSTNDIVEVSLGGGGAGPAQKVLGVVVETPASPARGVRVIIGAGATGPQVVDVAEARLICKGASAPWSSFHTQQMAEAAIRPAATHSSTPSPARTVSPFVTPSAPVRSPPAPLMRQLASRASAAPAGRRLEMDEDLPPFQPASLASSVTSAAAAEVSASSLPAAGGHVCDANALREVCALVDTVLCGPDPRLPAAMFGVLALWVVISDARLGAVTLAVARLVVVAAGVLVGWSALSDAAAAPAAATASSSGGNAVGGSCPANGEGGVLPTPGSLCRAVLVVLVLATTGVPVMSIALLVALVYNCATEFERRGTATVAAK